MEELKIFVLTNYNGDIIDESMYASKLWNKAYETYSQSYIRECEIMVVSANEYKRRFGGVQ